jgi:lysophospholipase L1-like esterase
VSSSLRRSAAFLLLVAFLGVPASPARAGYDGPGDFSAAEVRDHWFAAWAGPAQDTSTSATPRVFAPDTTIREPVWLTLGGSRLRVKLSNAMGTAPVTIGTASVAIRSTDSSVDPSTIRQLTFGGKPSVDLPPQGLVLSDPVELDVPSLTDVSVSIYLPNGSPPATQYPGSRKTTYVATGDATFDAVFPTASTLANGYFVAAVEAWSRRASGVVAAVGDSIVAGGGSTGENTKWSDRLAVRLDALPGHHAKSVLGLGIGGNRMLSGAITNPAALARFDRDALGMAGLTHVIMADGINDLGATAADPTQPPFAEDVANGLRQIVARAHARGVKVIGTTMGPAWGFRGYEAVEAKRLAYNAWMRSEGVKLVDGLVDFDAVLRDPSDPSHMNPLYNTDGIHPNNLGHQAMADAVNLLLLK